MNTEALGGLQGLRGVIAVIAPCVWASGGADPTEDETGLPNCQGRKSKSRKNLGCVLSQGHGKSSTGCSSESGDFINWGR